MDDDRTQIWNCGGGTQSTAIAALIIQDKLPKPDLAIIVDTERERSTTWDYLNKWTAPALRERGVTIHRVPKSKYATVDLWGGEDGDTLLIPAFTTQDGEVGKLPSYCSHEWKTRVIQRWATKEHGVTKATNWLGMSLDEGPRINLARTQQTGKWRVWYPLVDQMINRAGCYGIVSKMGWPQPPRSACWMCPNAGNEEWRATTPEDKAKAVTFEAEIRARDPHAWLHVECKPLDQVDFTQRQSSLFGCDSGQCFT